MWENKYNNGNVLFLVLVAIVLFAALSYGLTRVGGGSGNINKEKDLIALALSQQCNAYVDSGVDRLELISKCTAEQISYELPDGTNTNPLAPIDKHCHVFDSAGTGLTACGAYLTPTCDIADLANPGDQCDSVVFAGVQGGRLYTSIADQSTGALWGITGGATGAVSTADGLANTNILLAISPTNYLAAQLCRALGVKWYLPAINELSLLYTNRVAIGGFNLSAGSKYWSSTESSAPDGWMQAFDTGSQSQYYTKGVWALNIRCVRRD